MSPATPPPVSAPVQTCFCFQFPPDKANVQAEAVRY